MRRCAAGATVRERAPMACRPPTTATKPAIGPRSPPHRTAPGRGTRRSRTRCARRRRRAWPLSLAMSHRLRHRPPTTTIPASTRCSPTRPRSARAPAAARRSRTRCARTSPRCSLRAAQKATRRAAPLTTTLRSSPCATRRCACIRACTRAAASTSARRSRPTSPTACPTSATSTFWAPHPSAATTASTSPPRGCAPALRPCRRSAAVCMGPC